MLKQPDSSVRQRVTVYGEAGDEEGGVELKVLEHRLDLVHEDAQREQLRGAAVLQVVERGDHDQRRTRPRQPARWPNREFSTPHSV